MSESQIALAFQAHDETRMVKSGDVVASTAAELVAAVPALQEPANLGRYADAVNYLARGRQYRPIHDPDNFRAQYESRFQAEDPRAPFVDGEPRLSQFGHCEMDELQRPRVEGATVIFYAEHTYLGIPYRVTAPAPGQPEGEIKYVPLPMTPLPEEATTLPAPPPAPLPQLG